MQDLASTVDPPGAAALPQAAATGGQLQGLAVQRRLSAVGGGRSSSPGPGVLQGGAGALAQAPADEGGSSRPGLPACSCPSPCTCTPYSVHCALYHVQCTVK